MGIEELIVDLARKEGMEKGMEQGIEKTTLEITIRSLKNGMTLDLISNITGLAVEEIERIAKKVR